MKRNGGYHLSAVSFLRPENNDGEKHIEFLRASAMQPADAHFRIL